MKKLLSFIIFVLCISLATTVYAGAGVVAPGEAVV